MRQLQSMLQKQRQTLTALLSSRCLELKNGTSCISEEGLEELHY